MNHERADRPPVLGMVLKGYPRISETFISNEIRMLERMGFSIHIFSMRAPRENFSHASVKEIRARVTYLPESLLLGLPRLAWQNLKYCVKHPLRWLRGVGLMLSRFPGAPKKHTWLKHFLQAAYLVERAEAAGGVAHLHAHFAHTPSSVALYAAMLADVPFSFTAHAKDIYTQAPERLAAKAARARFVATCTKYNARHLRTLLPPDVPAHCVYHGIDLSLFSRNGRAPEAAPPYALLSVARMVEKKGLDTVLRALRLLMDEGLDVRWTLVGGGELKDRVRALAEELGLADAVTFVDTIPHEQVLDLYRGADAFVLGCRIAPDGDRDGIPNVVAESFAMGVPVAITDVSGIPELVEHEKTGLLCPPDDPRALADNIRRLLTDQDLRRSVIPAAEARVREVFDNRRCLAELAEVYVSHGVPRVQTSAAEDTHR